MCRLTHVLPIAFALLLTSTVLAQNGVPSQVAMINDHIQQGWADFEIRPAKEVGDAKW